MHELIFSLILDGLTLGCVYALIALGYTMVYGIIKLINFAHGEFYMMGAYAAFGVMCLVGDSTFGLKPPYDLIALYLLALVVAGLAAGVLAVVVEKLAYKPIRRSTRIAALLTALGVSLFLQNVAIKGFTAKARVFPPPTPTRVYRMVPDRRYPRIEVPASTIAPDAVLDEVVLYEDSQGEENLLNMAGKPVDPADYDRAVNSMKGGFYRYPFITVGRRQMIVWFSVLVLTAGLHVLVRYSRIGKAMRAVSHDREAAELMGINVNRVIGFTFFVGAFLAGAGGVLVGAYYGQIKPGMGLMYGLKAFVAAVVGGIGSIGGAVLGGLLLGVSESLVQISSTTAPFRDAFSFAILILILVFLPRGFLGRHEREKI